MQYTTCKCGNYQQISSGMAPVPCMGCAKCGTIPGYPPQQPLKQHEFVPEDVETNDGGAKLDRCKWCGHTRAQLENLGERPSSGGK